MPNLTEWISAQEAAKRLGLSQSEMAQLMVTGQISSTSGGKVSAQAVAALAAHRAKTA
jgi:hypothetical protein